jgi:hypothetical protein
MAKPKLKVKKIVKQNLAGRSVGAKIEAKNNWQRRDLNPRPTAYELIGGKATNSLLSRPLASFLTSTLRHC